MILRTHGATMTRTNLNVRRPALTVSDRLVQLRHVNAVSLHRSDPRSDTAAARPACRSGLEERRTRHGAPSYLVGILQAPKAYREALNNVMEIGMSGLILSAEQIRSAPPEVRHWLRGQLEAEFGGEAAGTNGLGELGPSLAVCGLGEAEELLERIRSDFFSTQVFFELGSEVTSAGGLPDDLHRVTFLDIVRHTRVGNVQHLADCLDTITTAFRIVRDDPVAALFAYDAQGGVVMHRGTHDSISTLWHRLVARQIARTVRPSPVGVPE